MKVIFYSPPSCPSGPPITSCPKYSIIQLMFAEKIKEELKIVLSKLQIPISEEEIMLEHPADMERGDYSTNIALVSAKLKSPKELAEDIVKKWQEMGLPDFVGKIEIAGPGFINIWLNFTAYSKQLTAVLNEKENFGFSKNMAGKKIMVEFAHPNTHKELHIGHMRTLITGEALARILTAAGATVFRANYQGDIGPHVAKSIWGTQKLLNERKMTLEEAEKLSLPEKAHLLGEGYVLGVKEYESSKTEIDQINSQLYQKETQILPIYDRTRRWSLDYYDSFYTRFYTKFDRLFFESEVAKKGQKLVEENIGKVFEKSEGAIIFDGEKYARLAEDGESRRGLHKRVFITADGNPTYEAKDMGLAYEQFKAFPFDLNIHVVANEQSGYFQVMIKALETLDPSFIGKEYHLPMGMVNLVGKKMSSRTGVILKVDDLLDEVKSLVRLLIKEEGLIKEKVEDIAEKVTIGAVKYSVLKVDPKANVLFDIEKSVSLQGNSGPYLQYTYARTQSVLRKQQSIRATEHQSNRASEQNEKISEAVKLCSFDAKNLSSEEQLLLRTIYKFPEVVVEAARTYSPNLICNFLYDLSQKFNLFYDRQRIIGSENEPFRLCLTNAVGKVLKTGLGLLGIEVLEKM